MQIAILVIFILAILFSVKFLKHRKVIVLDMEPALLKKILEDQVPFYQQLIENKKAEFEERTTMFLRQVKITGIKTKVEDLDRVLIAARFCFTPDLLIMSIIRRGTEEIF